MPLEPASKSDVTRVFSVVRKNTWYVTTGGNDSNDGMTPGTSFLTIAQAVSVASENDIISIGAGSYAEDVDLTVDGILVIGNDGAEVTGTSAAVPAVTISGDDITVRNLRAVKAGQVGFSITGVNVSVIDAVAYQCDIGFYTTAALTTAINCRAIDCTTNHFQISSANGYYRDCIARGDGGARVGYLLDVVGADTNTFVNCHSAGNATNGWSVAIAGANSNIFSHCSSGVDDGVKLDLGTDNSWDGFFIGSLIAAGNSVDEDLKDIYDVVVAIPTPSNQSLTHNVEVAHGVAETDIAAIIPLSGTPTHTEAQVDLNALVVAGEGTVITIRLYNLIDGVNRRIIDMATFDIILDEIHPSVRGRLDPINGGVLTIECSTAVTAQRACPCVIYHGGS